MSPNDYSYESAGFDGFLSRSIDNLTQTNLDSAGPLSTAIRYDGGQISGAIGDLFAIGGIVFNGKDGTITIGSQLDAAAIVIDGKNRKITISDENNQRIIIGNIASSG